jgi:phage terminase large subunit
VPFVSPKWLGKRIADTGATTGTVGYDFERYRAEPARFSKEELGITPWLRQDEILRCVVDKKGATIHKVAVRSGHKVSKSTSAAILALYWISLGGRCFVTAPTYRQVKDIIWQELRKLYPRVREKLGGGPLPKDPATGLYLPNGGELKGISTDKPEALAGISGANLLFIIDEGSGFPDDLFRAILGNSAGGSTILALSNPTKSTGWFFEAFQDGSTWKQLHISSAESPNVAAKKILVPGLATAEYVEAMAAEWGVDSADYQVRVDGNFPLEGSNTVIPLKVVEACFKRYETAEPPDNLLDHRLEVGVDVARFGDDKSTVYARRGSWFFPSLVLTGQDVVKVARSVEQYVLDLMTEGEKEKGAWATAPRIKVDTVGIGAGVADLLRAGATRARYGNPVGEIVDIDASRNAMDHERFVNVRTESWFAARKLLSSGAAIPKDVILQADLTSATYTYDKDQRYVLEPKDKMKERISRSPDRGDGLVLCCYEPPTTIPGGVHIEDL